jgi:GMP synthase (glutamine-hydrolysing)
MLLACSPPGSECEVVFPSDTGVGLPDAVLLKAFDGVAWTGCSLCINDDCAEVRRQIEFAGLVFRQGIPSFGSCWAAQIAVAAAGGRVQANPHGREMGIARKIRLTPEGRAHPMYVGKPSVFDGFTSHDDEITHLPPGAVALSGNAWTLVQSVSVSRHGGEFWGLQYHPEYDLHELARLTFCRIDRLLQHGFFRCRDDALHYIELVETLHRDPARKDIAWLLGIDADVMDEGVRWTEVRNWVNRLVLARMQA